MTDRSYRADPPESRVQIPLDGHVLVYHRPSGGTHILASPAPEILDALAEGPADAARIAALLAAHHEIEADGEAATVIAARLAELEAAGLVERL